MAKGSITVSGQVLDVTERSGKNADTGNSWAFTIVSILAGKSVQEVRWDSDTIGGKPAEGQEVAVEVRLSTYKGFVQASALGYAPALHVASPAKTA